MSRIESINERVFTLPQLLESVANAKPEILTGVFIGIDESGEPRLWASNITDVKLAFICKALEGWTYQTIFGLRED